MNMLRTIQNILERLDALEAATKPKTAEKKPAPKKKED